MIEKCQSCKSKKVELSTPMDDDAMAKNLPKMTWTQTMAMVKARKKLINFPRAFGVSRQTVGTLMRKDKKNKNDMATRKGAGQINITKANKLAKKLAKRHLKRSMRKLLLWSQAVQKLPETHGEGGGHLAPGVRP